ncbi:MAG TPA: SsrA-binding protein SmpB [Desulfatiglandales bacterium]|nr:SsrA-binding protein SmpB [Desulfatiglandales bacterium]
MDKKIVCQNKKAFHDYTIDEVLEAGIVLLGPEVKSLRDGRSSLVDGYARIKNGEVFVYNMHITPYPYAHNLNLDPKRTRKLLLNRQEIRRLIGKTKEKGYTLIPLKVYFSDSRAKVELGLAKGKKKVDKRHALREKEQKREIEQARKRRNY